MNQCKVFRALNFAALFLVALSFSRSAARAVDPANDPQLADSLADFRVKSDPNYLPTDSRLNRVERDSIDKIRTNFAKPGVDFATAPLWVWNDLLSEEQIRASLADLNAQRVNQAFVHPRPGLATPYLSDQWFKLWDAALDEAQKRDMKIWIYDENSYPSGFAGGLVPDVMPESRGQGLDVLILDALADADGKWIAGDSVAYVVELFPNGDAKDRTSEILTALKSNRSIPEATNSESRWIVARVQFAGSSQWHGGKTYVNLIQKGVLDKFIGITHESYRKHYSDKFGALIPGAFTDEPNLASAGMFAWCDDFASEFRARRGYDLVVNLGSLVSPIGEWKKVRYDYYKTVLELFIERWHKPFAEYCESVGLEYCGHDWEHEWPNARHVPDNMATAFWRQRPSIDLLMNQFSRGTHSQFGNVRAVRELSSATRQAGRSRSLSENYGAGGYDIRFADLKRLGDWAFALGVNTSDEHLSYISIRGARKHDHPQTFSYHSPWFEQYSKLEDYWTRLSYLTSRGELTKERVLILEPTSTVWIYQNFAGDETVKKDRVANLFTDLLNRLEEEQIDYDLGSEDVVERVGSVDGAQLVVGAASYATVALPPELETLDPQVVHLLAKFVQNGGTLVSLGANFTLVGGREITKCDAQIVEDCATLAKAMKEVSEKEFVNVARSRQPIVVAPKTNAENVFHIVRETEDAMILFVCNIDLENEAACEIALSNAWKDAALEEFDLATGAIRSFDQKTFALGPCSSLALVVSKKGGDASKREAINPVLIDSATLLQNGSLRSVRAIDDNVLVLDYMTVKMGGETLENEYFYRANGWFWNKKGFPKSPWDAGVQFKDELISKRFDDESGFELIYQFDKSGAKIDDLRFVVENPDMFEVYCNGCKAERIPNSWKFDRSFGVFDVASMVKEGRNEMKLVAPKSTIFTELMPAWIIGTFSLEPQDVGFKIVASKDLRANGAENDENDWRASSEIERVAWLSSGIGFSNVDDSSPSLTFSFPENVAIDALDVWNYCEVNLPKRGVKDAALQVVDENGAPAPNVKPIPIVLKQGDSRAQRIALPTTVKLASNQKLLMTIKSNWNGVSFPTPETFIGSKRESGGNDNAFVGLAEIKFLAKGADGALIPISARPEVKASSELVFRNHDRRAEYVVDGSGMYRERSGWAAQGYPFYGGAVDYNFVIPIDDLPKDRPISLNLTEWDGAVAAILIDGVQCGAVGWKAELVDVGAPLRAAQKNGKSSVSLTVRVYGTPKNTFGPHHAGKLRGSAWPGSFHNAPKAQPSGSDYDVIEYGLFAP